MSQSSKMSVDNTPRSLIEEVQRQIEKQSKMQTLELVHLKSHLAAFADHLHLNADYDPDRLTPVTTIERHVAGRLAESSM